MNENNDIINPEKITIQQEPTKNKTIKIVCYVAGAVLFFLTACTLLFLLFMINVGVTVSVSLGGFVGQLLNFLN